MKGEELNRLKELMSTFERATTHQTGVHRISGGFAIADLDEVKDGKVYLTLKWGVQNDGENNVHTEHFYFDEKILSAKDWDAVKAEQQIMEAN